MRLSPQARKTYASLSSNLMLSFIHYLTRTNIVLSNPELTSKQRAKCVNALAGVFTKRSITRDQSILEVAATITVSTLSSQSARASHPVGPFLIFFTGLRSEILKPYLASWGLECFP